MEKNQSKKRRATPPQHAYGRPRALEQNTGKGAYKPEKQALTEGTSTVAKKRCTGHADSQTQLPVYMTVRNGTLIARHSSHMKIGNGCLREGSMR
eukprot:1160608-Pelagomonas_calceolata.AAC.10